MGETALLVEVAEAEELVGPWRSTHDPVATRGVPAHVTVLFPFVPPDRFDDAVVQRLADVVGATPAFSFRLTAVEEFPGVVWLRPEPDVPFATLTQRIWSAFPDFPPYGGRFTDSVPHLTVAMVDTEGQVRVGRPNPSGAVSRTAGRLPCRRRVDLHVRRSRQLATRAQRSLRARMKLP